MDPESIRFHEPAWEEQRACDGCLRKIENGDHVAIYFSDWVLNEYSDGPIPVIAPHGMYCLDCYEDEIPLPKQGVNEGFLFETVRYDPRDEVYTVETGEIMRGSSASQGIDWDPVSVFEMFHPAPAEAALKDGTPFSVYVLLFRSGVDLKGFVRDGELDIPKQAEEKARLIISESIKHHPSWGMQAESL